MTLRKTCLKPVPVEMLRHPGTLLWNLLKQAHAALLPLFLLQVVTLLVGAAGFLTFRFLLATFYQGDLILFDQFAFAFFVIAVMRVLLTRRLETKLLELKSGWKRRLRLSIRECQQQTASAGLKSTKAVYAVCEATTRLASMVTDSVFLLPVVVVIAWMSLPVAVCLLFIVMVAWASSLVVGRMANYDAPKELRDRLQKNAKSIIELVAISAMLVVLHTQIGKLSQMQIMMIVFCVVISMRPIHRLRTFGDTILEMHRATRELAEFAGGTDGEAR